MSILTALKLPLKIIAGLVKNKRKIIKSPSEEKMDLIKKHVRNFAPRHYSQQKNLEKRKVKKINKKKKDNNFNS